MLKALAILSVCNLVSASTVVNGWVCPDGWTNRGDGTCTQTDSSLIVVFVIIALIGCCVRGFAFYRRQQQAAAMVAVPVGTEVTYAAPAGPYPPNGAPQYVPEDVPAYAPKYAEPEYVPPK